MNYELLVHVRTALLDPWFVRAAGPTWAAGPLRFQMRMRTAAPGTPGPHVQVAPPTADLAGYVFLMSSRAARDELLNGSFAEWAAKASGERGSSEWIRDCARLAARMPDFGAMADFDRWPASAREEYLLSADESQRREIAADQVSRFIQEHLSS